MVSPSDLTLSASTCSSFGISQALHVTFELLRRGGTSSALEESIRTEVEIMHLILKNDDFSPAQSKKLFFSRFFLPSQWRVAKKMFERPDFFEGVRCILCSRVRVECNYSITRLSNVLTRDYSRYEHSKGTRMGCQNGRPHRRKKRFRASFGLCRMGSSNKLISHSTIL